MSIIQIKGLQFGYHRKQTVLEELDMQVPEGSIYGFLGSNGAGKSTTIRALLGLLRPRAGEINILGQSLKIAKPQLFRELGALIELPSLYPHLSAQDHLRLACRYHHVGTQNIAPLLDKVGLLAHRNKATKNFSTGMKQRMGLAMALIHEPRLLILDEPSNGLDPQGISDIRDLLLELREEGKTILLSSHLLSEIEKIATQVGILKDGRMIFEGSITDLKKWKSSNPILEIRVNDPSLAEETLAESRQVIRTDSGWLHIQLQHENDIPDLVRQLVDAQLDIYEISLQKNDLEKLFMEATRN